MKKIYKENILGKSALLWALDCAFDLNRGCGCEFWSDRESDYIKFGFDGHMCKVLSVDSVDYEGGTIGMTILAKGKELTEWERISLTFMVRHFRYETLRKIVEEFYMCSNACNNDTWGDDVASFIKDKQADWFDSWDCDGENNGIPFHMRYNR